MQSEAELKSLLSRIDHRGYPAYKDTKGQYRFPGYVLSIDHVQGDPFASPSKVSVLVSGKTAGFPQELYCGKCQRIALQDELLRQFGKCGQMLWQRAQGIDERPVEPSRVRKSVGVELTLPQDLYRLDEMLPILISCARNKIPPKPEMIARERLLTKVTVGPTMEP